MILIEPFVEEIFIDSSIDKIARVARNCYLSTPRSDDESPFVGRLVANDHLAMIEHYQFTFKVNKSIYDAIKSLNNPFIYMTDIEEKYLITTSLRPIIEVYKKNDKENPLCLLISSLSDKEKKVFFPGYEEKGTGVTILSHEEIMRLSLEERRKHLFITMRLITDRGVSHEIVRHRRASFAQESTRYCNYAKDKFSNQLTFIKPLDYDKNRDIYDDIFVRIEKDYMELAERKTTPEYARTILPNSLKTSIVVTCNLQEWELIFHLRLAQAAHPDMIKVMKMVKEQFVQASYLVSDEVKA